MAAVSEHYREHTILFALNTPTQGAINITIKDGKYNIRTPLKAIPCVWFTSLKAMVTKDAEITTGCSVPFINNVANALYLPGMPHKGQDRLCF